MFSIPIHIFFARQRAFFAFALLQVSLWPAGCERPQAPASQRSSAPAASSPPSLAPRERSVLRDEPQGAAVSPDAPSGPAPMRTLLRPADDRPPHKDEVLRELGIQRYESTRLVLYSDIDPEIARTLPPLIDAAYLAWVEYFGELPPAEDGSEFQLTGYLMQDRKLFLEAGLLPEDLIEFEHGRHRGYRFWMHEQRYDYYRRHLLIHEGTHCFMMIVPALSRPPLFYLEGMAELFGTHAVGQDGGVVFRAMPEDPNEAVGFGRIEMIQQAVAEGEAKSFEQALALSANDFSNSRSGPYAWSWALCKFLDTHPQYRDRFRKLADAADGAEFSRELRTLFTPDLPRLQLEWDLFVRTLTYGYDLERAALDFVPGEEFPPGSSLTVPVDAAQGWQSASVQVEAGREYRLSAEGEVTLGSKPRPWLSQPQGVTIHYSGGRPIGRVLAAIHGESAAASGDPGGFTQPLDVGRLKRFTAPVDGTLYLRVNDSWGSLDDNAGAYRVTVEALAVD